MARKAYQNGTWLEFAHFSKHGKNGKLRKIRNVLENIFVWIGSLLLGIFEIVKNLIVKKTDKNSKTKEKKVCKIN